MKGQEFFFYDLETSGLMPRFDRIMQFAGQRARVDFEAGTVEKVGEPVNLLVKMTEDALPSPSAINVTGITPQATLMDGVSEAEFCRYVVEEVFTPGTVALGYNTVRFDDEFMRAILWRNFYDPYEWEWKDGRSRWDILDVVRTCRALRPEGIEWPFTPDGKATNRLELLTKCNGLSHEHAHDALSDVYATMAVMEMLMTKQPELVRYLYSVRGKRDVAKYVSVANPRPVVYVSGRYSAEFDKATVVVPIAATENGNVLVYDLRYHPEELVREVEEYARAVEAGVAEGERPGRKSFYPQVKELCVNKCPAVAPLGVLEKADGWEKLKLSREVVEKNWRAVRENAGLIAQMIQRTLEKPEYTPACEPEAALYDGFLSDADRVKVAAVRNADGNKLADFHPDFIDERLPELLLHYKGRNFPESLDAQEMEKWETYRRARLERQAPKFLAELAKVEDDFVRDELLLYYQSLGESE